MNTFSKLSRIALLGTEHSALDESTLEKLRSEGLDVSQPEPLLLAEGAALFSKIKKAGLPIQTFGGELPKTLESDGEPSCSLRSAEHLRLILDGKYAPALAEYMACLLENGLCLPTEHLPNLLQRSDLNEWWHLLEPALGQRGKWLLGQHPEWKKLVETTDGLDWQTGTKEERIRLLRHLRKHQPKLAIELLESTWETENHRDKSAFLAELFTGLSANNDESFLEKCRTDSRKNVRVKAFELLQLLPDSAYGERMFERAKKCLDWRRSKLSINLPDEPDDTAIADGILKFHPDWKGGKKAGYLWQVVSSVPPSLWELTWDREPDDILNSFEKTDWSEPLEMATAEATVRYEDGAWNKALLLRWFEEEESILWHESVGSQILSAADAQTVHQLAVNYLKKMDGLPDEDTPLFQLFIQNEAPWEDEITGEIISRFRAWLRQTKRPDFTTFHYKELLNILSYRCSAGYYEKLKTGWDSRVPLWSFWEKNIEEMIETVFFRLEMKLEMEN